MGEPCGMDCVGIMGEPWGIGCVEISGELWGCAESMDGWPNDDGAKGCWTPRLEDCGPKGFGLGVECCGT